MPDHVFCLNMSSIEEFTCETFEIPFDWELEKLRYFRHALAMLKGPVGSATNSLGFKGRLVGGWIRDLLFVSFNRKGENVVLTADLDLAVEGDARELGKLLQKEWGGTLLIHDRFLTATWQLDQQSLAQAPPPTVSTYPTINIDLITARFETYPRPGQLPRVSAGTFSHDAFRRDISINTFSLDLEQWPDFKEPPKGMMVHGCPGALSDLQNGVIRLLHAGSLQDDPTRIFRLARYEERFGFQQDPDTSRWLAQAIQNGVLATVSPDRIGAELEQVFEERRVSRVLRRLQEWGVLNYLGLNPGTERLWPALDRAAQEPEREVEVFWLLLLGLDQSQTLSPLQASLNLPATAERDILKFRQLVNLPWTDLPPSQLWLRLKQTNSAIWLALRVCLPDQATALTRYATDWRFVSTHLKGKDLIEMGYPPGPRIGQMLDELRSKKLDGELSTRSQELDLVQRILGLPPED